MSSNVHPPGRWRLGPLWILGMGIAFGVAIYAGYLFVGFW